MARRIYARLPSDRTAPLEFAIADAKGVSRLDGGPEDLRAGEPVIVFVPGTEVGSFKAAIPARNDREARRAALFAIEDDLASPAEQLHVSVSGPDSAGQRGILVCDFQQMQAWLQRLKTEKIKPAALVPEYAVLPDVSCVFDLGDRVLVNVNGQRAAIDADAPSELLRAIVATDPGEVEVHGRDVASLLNRPAISAIGQDAIASLARLEQENGYGHDLRQGDFAPRQSLALPELSTWRRPAALAAVAGITWLAAMALETSSLNDAARDLRLQATASYQAAFSEEGRVTDPARRINEKLAGGAASRLDFQRSVATLFQSLESVEGASLRGLRYDRAGGELRASVDYSSYGDDLRLAEVLGQSGFEAELGDTRSNGSAITGEVTVRARR